MTRLQSELQRLYRCDGSAQGLVRCALLELGRPADWPLLAPLWRGVQADLDLPAPAIAVSGMEGYQLWFSLREPVPAPQALAFLEGLAQRYLPGMPENRLLLSAGDTDALPPRQITEDQWSAFVSPDLAPVFDDAPWLDLPPGDESQADVLARIESIRNEAFDEALARLGATSPPSAVPAPPAALQAHDPRSFLLKVMNDDNVPMQLRIEAAKALLLSGQR